MKKPRKIPDKSANLQPREPEWGQTKTKRHPYLSDAAWEGLKAIAREMGYRSVSDLLERLGRKTLPLADLKKFLPPP